MLFSWAGYGSQCAWCPAVLSDFKTMHRPAKHHQLPFTNPPPSMQEEEEEEEREREREREKEREREREREIVRTREE